MKRKPGNPGTTVVKYTFPDGTVHSVPLVEVLATERDQLTKLLHMKREFDHANGELGGRPSVAPTRDAISDEYKKRCEGKPQTQWSAERTQLVKDLAGRHQVDDRTARGWVKDALGPKVTKQK
jgi:hypothetical protein